MSKPYSQFQALWAITKASLKAIFKSPQSVFFSLFFPIVLIVVFGALSRGGGVSVDIAFDQKTDTLNPVYYAIKNSPVFDIVKGTAADLEDRMKKGRITAILDVEKLPADSNNAKYDIHYRYSSANQRELPALQLFLNSVVNQVTQQQNGTTKVVTVSGEEVPGRIYKMIDFYLPGMIGFSLIGASVFGVAFLFFGLRETLVLKRMYASPVKKAYIVIGESLSRLIFQMTTVVVLILFGKYFYNFTLANGLLTFLELLVLSLVALMVFMGFGFIISSVAKNQNVIPIYANIFMFPQYFLSGTFFPKNALPQSIQWLVDILPLTALNDGLRKVAFEGAHLNDCWKQLLIMGVWGVIVYAAAVKVFRWE
ncbi:MAG TPA: ABC transporter permease [Chitinophagaceae bacterium]|jgi:ABC-2 type transport system permease protein|nr:ABC transporter permease [Chitinophagaceae bacterium]